MYNRTITKKKRLTSLLTALLLVLAMAASALPQEAWAAADDTFTADGIKYKVTDETEKTVSVAMQDSNSINGATFIPEKVRNTAGVEYTVTSIGDSAFFGCAFLTSVNIPDSVTSIGDYAFFVCAFLTSVSIPDSVTSIGEYAFFGCDTLTSVSIPDSVTSIGGSAFEGCDALSSIDVDTDNKAFKSEGGVLFSKDGVTLYTYPAGKTSPSYTVPDSVTSIGDMAFSECAALKSVVIPDSVTSIGTRTFNSCDALTSVSIPASVTSIGDSAFAGCSALESIDVDTNNKAFKSEGGTLFSMDGATLYAYPAGKNDSSYAIPASVTSIESSAFFGCVSLTSVNIPVSVTDIGPAAFAECSALESVIIPASVTSIEAHTFSECANLKSVVIPASVTSIGEAAFRNCPALTSVVIPASVTSIRLHAFDGCSSLTSVVIPASVTSISDNAFSQISATPQVTVMYGTDPSGEVISNDLKGKFPVNTQWFRGFHSFPAGTPDPLSLTLAQGTTYDIRSQQQTTDVVYQGENGVTTAPARTLPFTLAGNSSASTCIDNRGLLHIAADETGPLTIDAYGKTLTVTVEQAYRPPALWYTLTAEDITFPEMQQGDKPAAQPLTIRCQGNTGATVTDIRIEGEGFLAGVSGADPYVSPGNTNTTYRILPKAGLKPGSYEAKAVVTYGWGRTAEAMLTLTVTEAVQTAPKGFKTAAKTPTSLSLSWKAADRAEKYHVFRSTKKDGAYKRIASTGKTSLTNIRLTPGKRYYYKVRAYRTVDGKKVYSKFSAVISAVAKPKAPTFSLKAGRNQMTIGWKGASGADGYRIYRASSKSGKYHLVKDCRSGRRSYTSKGLKSRRTYYYKMRAYKVYRGKKVFSSYTLPQKKAAK